MSDDLSWDEYVATMRRLGFVLNGGWHDGWPTFSRIH